MKKLIVALLFIPSLSFAGDYHPAPTNTPQTETSSSSHAGLKIAISAIVIGGIICVVHECWKSDPPAKQDGSMVPDNANPGMMGVEIK